MFKVTMMRTLQTAAAGLLLAAAGAAHAQWMWIDAKGLKQVSDRPPPASVPNKNILKAPTGAAVEDPVAAQTVPAVVAAQPVGAPAAAEPGAPTAASAPAPAAPKGLTYAEREAEYRKRKTDQAAADKKSAEQATQAAAKASACKAAQENKAKLEAGGRIRTGAGRSEFMSDQERARNTVAAASFISEHCK